MTNWKSFRRVTFGSTVRCYCTLHILQTSRLCYCTVLHCTVLHCTVLHCTVLHCTVLHCTVLHCTALYCTALYCTVLHCTVLHCTELEIVKYSNTNKNITSYNELHKTLIYFLMYLCIGILPPESQSKGQW